MSMSTFLKHFPFITLASIFGLVLFYSCQKADPAPYSTPPSGITHVTTVTTAPDTTSTFSARVNNSQTATSFTPGKSTSGSNTTLTGVSKYYTITITFPSSSGPGDYTLGTSFDPDYTATLVNGSSTYVVNKRWGLGDLRIDSISAKGKYFGTFSLSAEDTTTNNDMQANQGSFTYL